MIDNLHLTVIFNIFKRYEIYIRSVTKITKHIYLLIFRTTSARPYVYRDRYAFKSLRTDDLDDISLIVTVISIIFKS
jgi:hypothetical protein